MSEPANEAEIIARNVVKVSGPSWPRGAQLDSRVHNCPCCGKPAYLVTVPKAFSPVYGVQYYYIGCSECSVRTALSSNLEILIEDWNTHHEPIPEWLKNELINAVCCAKDDATSGWNDAIEYILSLTKPEDSP